MGWYALRSISHRNFWQYGMGNGGVIGLSQMFNRGITAAVLAELSPPRMLALAATVASIYELYP